MTHKTKRLAKRTLLSFAMVLVLTFVMGITSWAAEDKEIGEGVTYTIGDTIVVPAGKDIYIIWDDSTDVPTKIDPKSYTIGDATFDAPEDEGDVGQFVINLNDPNDDDYLALGAEMDLTGTETVTGIKCNKGDGTEEHPYEFTLLFKKSGDEDEPVSYLTWDETEKKLVEKTCTDYSLFKGKESEDPYIEYGQKDMESWYVVDGEVTLDDTVMTQGDLHLILKDGSKLTADGLTAYTGNLTIYSQSTGDDAGIISLNNQGLYGMGDNDITINGGKIINTCGVSIQAFKDRYKGNLNINGGEITVDCNAEYGFDIRHNVTINGGKITISDAKNYGIYAGYDTAKSSGIGSVVINDGVINVESFFGGAGIYAGSDVEINGGIINARCLENGAGIKAGADFVIKGGTVTAVGEGTSKGSSGIYVGGSGSEIIIDESMLVMAGDDETSARDVTDQYKGKYAKRLVEEWVKIGTAKSNEVTFKVVNGSWDDGTSDDKTVKLKGFADDDLKLSEDLIPEVGSKPDDTYKAGSWDVVPSTETIVSEDVTYTYTYVQDDSDKKDDDKKEDEKDDKKDASKYSNEWVDGKWYDADGKQTYKATLSWKNDAKGWWVEDTSGWYAKNEWVKIDGKWYFFCADGYMDYSEYRDGCWLGADGAWVEEFKGGHWMQDSKGWWYEDESGWYPKSQWLWIDGSCYYFGSDGYIYTNRYVDGSWVGADGAWIK